MISNELNDLKANALLTDTIEEEFSTPLCIADIISICQEYSNLGSKIQYQIGVILEDGIEEAIKTNKVKAASLPHIKEFLNSICQNIYFGDAITESRDCIELIKQYEDKHIEEIKFDIN